MANLFLKDDAAVAANKAAKEKVFAGTLGALLFSLGGGLIWILLDRVGFMAGIAGLAAVFLAIKGYQLFGRKLTRRGVIISIIVSVLVLILAWYICLTLDFHEACKTWYENGEMTAVPSFIHCFFMAYMVLSDGTMAASYIGSLLIGLVLCAVVSFFFLRGVFASLKETETGGKGGEPEVVAEYSGAEAEEVEAAGDNAAGYGEIEGKAADYGEAEDNNVGYGEATDNAADYSEAVEKAADNAEKIVEDAEKVVDEAEKGIGAVNNAIDAADGFVDRVDDVVDDLKPNQAIE